MSKETTEDAAPKTKKKGGLGIKLLAGVVLLGVGGGGAYGLMLSGLVGEHGSGKEEDKKPQLVRKGEEDPYAPKVEGKDEGAAETEDGVGGDPYRTSYYTFVEEFTSNLRSSGHFVQLSLAASTNYDGRVLAWLKKHELAIRSAILIVLADTSEEEAYSVTGKERLQKRLTSAINEVLVKHEGFGGIKAVHFKSYIVQ